MMAAGEKSPAVDHTIGRDGVRGIGAGYHGPADHTRGHAGAEGRCDGAVGGDAAFWYLAYQLVNEVEERIVFFAGGFYAFEHLQR